MQSMFGFDSQGIILGHKHGHSLSFWGGTNVAAVKPCVKPQQPQRRLAVSARESISCLTNESTNRDIKCA